MTQTYQHTFPDGHKITLVVDYSGQIPRMASDHANGIPSQYRVEFEKWVGEVITPLVHKSLSEEQERSLAIIGMKRMGAL